MALLFRGVQCRNSLNDLYYYSSQNLANALQKDCLRTSRSSSVKERKMGQRGMC